MFPFDDPIPVKGSLMDFTSLRSLSPTIHEMDGGGMPGIDHAFILQECKQEHEYKDESESGCKESEYKVGSTNNGEGRCEGRNGDNGCNSGTKTLQHAAILLDEESGRQFDLYTTECALIVYTSNWLNETAPFVPVGIVEDSECSIMPFA